MLAAVLSVAAPGLGQIYTGNAKKGLSVLCVYAGLLIAPILSHSYLITILAVVIYLVTVVPVTADAYQTAATGRSHVDIDAKWYVFLMLWFTGFSALPLLWQSKRFSHRAKTLLTTAVILLTVLFFGGLVIFGPTMEKFLRHLPELPKP